MMKTHFQEILAETADLAKCFTDSGEEIYLVGGSIRDLLLGDSSDKKLDKNTDLDLCTSAHPKQTKALLKKIAEDLWNVGERFGTIGCVYNNRVYEVTTFRREVYEAGTRKPQVEFGTDILEDLMRRDFTINAMALKLPDGELIDPHNGQQDLKNRQLCTPIDPMTLFREDPLRMLRAARFEAQLELTPTKEILSALRESVERLDIVSKERQADELRRLLCLADPTAGLIRLIETGLLAKVLPDVEFSDVAKIKALQPDFLTRLAGLLFNADIENAESSIAQLKLSKKDSRETRTLIGLAQSANEISENLSPVTLRTLTRDAKTYRTWTQILDLLHTFHPDNAQKLQAQFDATNSETDDLFSVEPLLSSQEIMEILGIPAGPEVGRAKAILEDLYIEKGNLSKEQAISELRERLP